jgi:serine/threonine-protein kinase
MSTHEKLTRGTILGRYELLLPIAQGGMATVWAARQRGSRGFQKTVAVKTMLPALSDDAQFEQMFLDEASLAARIHHPNVAEILDLGEQDDVLYIVMEWVDGEALSVIHKTAKRSNLKLPQRIALRMVSQACAGLHAAHELKDENELSLELVHRDVSPQNVLVTYDGIVKLVDFGVAKAVGRAGGETTAGQLKGKVPYMSPEQARGGNVDRRTDIFAMGIVLYKLTTGVHPFLGENDLVTMKNIISRPVLSPRAKVSDYPADLEHVLLKCLQKEPDKRFQTMAELDRAIERVLATPGGSIMDDDIGTFVRMLMGDRGQKRRASIRDAIRSADERDAGVGAPPAVGPIEHEGISDIVLTALASGVKEELLPDRPSPTSAPVGPVSVTSDALVAFAANERELSPTGETAAQARRRGYLIAAGATCVASAALAFALLRPATAPPPSSAAVAAMPPPPPAPPPPAPTPALSASVEAPTTPLDEADDLVIEEAKATTTSARRPRAAAAKTPEPAETAEAEVAPTKKPWVPAVKDPGF